jgi:hypothetical protein
LLNEDLEQVDMTVPSLGCGEYQHGRGPERVSTNYPGVPSGPGPMTKHQPVTRLHGDVADILNLQQWGSLDLGIHDDHVAPATGAHIMNPSDPNVVSKVFWLTAVAAHGPRRRYFSLINIWRKPESEIKKPPGYL